MCSTEPFKFRWSKEYFIIIIKSEVSTFLLFVFPWMGVCGDCTMIFCQLFQTYPGKLSIFTSVCKCRGVLLLDGRTPLFAHYTYHWKFSMICQWYLPISRQKSQISLAIPNITKQGNTVHMLYTFCSHSLQPLSCHWVFLRKSDKSVY